MDKWEGAVAVVTGASAGIGKGVAITLADHGLIVAALARRFDRLEELANSFKGRGRIIALKCDVTEQEEVENAFKKIEDEHGRIRILVNSAGIAYCEQFSDLRIDLWKKTFNLNVFGMFHGIKYVMESVKKSDPGLVHIFNLNSVAGHYKLESPNLAAYQAAKHSVTILSRALNQQIALDKLNIRVTSLSPSNVKSELVTAGNWGPIEWYDTNPHLLPEDIGNTIVSILSFESNIVITELMIKPKGDPL